MKCLSFITVLIILLSCCGGQKLLQQATADGGRITVKRDFFSGIDYIYVEKRLSGRINYKLFYDCECGINNKISLRKDYVNEAGTTNAWTAVTDTSSIRSQSISFFEEKIIENRLHIPIEFRAITEEEMNILKESLNKVSKECCKNPNKPIDKVLGFVRLKIN